MNYVVVLNSIDQFKKCKPAKYLYFPAEVDQAIAYRKYQLVWFNNGIFKITLGEKFCCPFVENELPNKKFNNEKNRILNYLG